MPPEEQTLEPIFFLEAFTFVERTGELSPIFFQFGRSEGQLMMVIVRPFISAISFYKLLVQAT